jgi:hypothetical protein
MADSIATPACRDGRLQVQFVRRVDRLGHVIQLVVGEVVRPVLESVEGTSLERWPPSPVLQHLHIENRLHPVPAIPPHDSPECSVALLVGMGGRSHWSLSVEPERAVAALLFDVACRVDAESSPELRSTYQCLVPPSLIEAQRCVCELDGWRIAVTSAPRPETSLQVHERGLSLAPLQPTGATRRWQYQVALY